MEAKLIKGGEVISKASQQEAQLRKAEALIAERQGQEIKLAKELAEKEEANLQLEEHFSSLQEEVEVKTKKLKKLWLKFQAATSEAQDLQEEFQNERSDMLDTIRHLTRTMKLKDLIIANFIPEEFAKGIEKRAIWTEDEECWNVQKNEFAGNKIRTIRPISSSKLRRPESEYSRQRKQYDSNPRYKYDNITSMELDNPERTTQDFDGPGMASRVDDVLSMNMNIDDDSDITFAASGIPSPYQQYAVDPNSDNVDKERKEKKKSSKSKSNSDRDRDGSSGSSRPKSAARSREGNSSTKSSSKR
jgi:kinesin family protein 3/17